MTSPAARRTLRPPAGYRLARSVRALTFSAYDPCARIAGGTFWWATRTPAGPATLALRPAGDELVAEGYGPGADWVAERAEAIAGLGDDLAGFADLAAAHPLVARLAREHHGLRMPATGQVFPRLLRAVLEQKVTGKEAYRAYAATVRHFREAAPGPVPLLLPPEAAAVAATPYWVFHPFGVEQRRADTLRRAAAAAERLEQCADTVEATRRLTAIPGIGPWTAAEVVRIAYGDPDAVSVGDYHIPNTVAWALAGEPRGDDARMLALLEPFRGHRGRVCLLLEAAGIQAPRYGPRATIRSFARY
ncbi:DNA-3-methyladenine glycosylase 2 family protein [Micromonospora sp. DR5-3]|uniref:DNA-3-methyladenine glycosylase family protein n=1 Tax=unclassified Micromonospora TaxID=2617518 RepID=UPI0011DBAB03|nr:MULTISPECIES: DNA-3-methyladenine glycosylase 2 family protein [unclassified Micromonospora]MCW3813266.1 DNA-3-methyladenine glycosylase 2 family protein [Micromonospora sp. DR5-3]TYC24656.1 DNA-3-methyladenine glycosylase 2 family protein [Micromonospora sp. MP36]